ncbi:hypothetical protein V7166_06030, partial [Bacillus thuringiensis]
MAEISPDRFYAWPVPLAYLKKKGFNIFSFSYHYFANSYITTHQALVQKHKVTSHSFPLFVFAR